MKIGIVLSATPGYSETFFNAKIKGLQEKGYQVTVFAQKVAPNFSNCKVIKAAAVPKLKILLVIEVLKQSLLLLPYLSRVVRYWKLEKKEGTSFKNRLKKTYLNAHLLRAKVDWLHYGFATIAIGSETVAKAIGAKMAISFRGFDINVYPLKHPDCYDGVFKHVDKVHSISKYLYEKAIDIGLSPTVPHQIITPATTLVPQGKTSKTDPIVFVTVARLTWIKGLDVAIAALQLLKESGIYFKYKVIGGGLLKDKERYVYQAYEAGLKNEVQFLGALSHRETIDEMNKCSIYLQPSINEGFCNAVLEGQALGKLVIASNVGGLPENLDNGKTGFLFEVGNAQDLFDNITAALELTEKERNKITDAAIKRVASNFTIEAQQKHFVTFYTETL